MNGTPVSLESLEAISPSDGEFMRVDQVRPDFAPFDVVGNELGQKPKIMGEPHPIRRRTIGDGKVILAKSLRRDPATPIRAIDGIDDVPIAGRRLDERFDRPGFSRRDGVRKIRADVNNGFHKTTVRREG
jgi:hypothetical protein